MKRTHILTVLLFASVLVGQAKAVQDDGMNTGIIYGTGHAFALTAPTGWVLDNKSGVHQGLFAVFYPKGSSWTGSKEVMYVNTSSKEKGDTLQSMIQSDVAEYRDDHQTKKIEDGQPLTTKDGRKVTVKYFLGDNKGNYEAVAYVEEKYIVAYLVFSTKDEGLFRKDLPFFKELVGSYKFLTDNPNEAALSGTPLDFVIPADILQTAQKELNTTEGSKYDEKFGPYFQKYSDCMSGEKANGWHRIVLEIAKDGTPIHIYVQRHDPVNDCLAPKFQKEKFPPPPFAPFYYLFELNVTP